jgi:mannose-6-phosphate isomerase-like protein (cupin superfamily)
MIGLIQGKIWGTTQCIFRDNNVEIHRIAVKLGGYCSRHRHAAKYNQFFVESGKLKVTIFRGSEERATDSTVLTAGMASLIKPNEVHMFEALEATVAYEIYWVSLNPEDIIRESEGGIKSEA